MRAVKLLSWSLLLAAGCSSQAATQIPQTTRAVTLFEGARLIVGDQNAPIENSACLVENNRFTKVGRKGELQIPAGAARVDLTGKTVMPALVELHAHLGYWKGPANTNLVENFTRENVLDHLQRFAYHGVAAVLSLGTDRRELAYQLRDEWRKAPPRDTARGYFGWSSHMEMAGLVKAGFTPAEAIAVATRNPAELFGLHELGTVAAGKSADFIVLNANPLDDIANTRRIASVYLRGQEVDRARLRAKWTGRSSSNEQ